MFFQHPDEIDPLELKSFIATSKTGSPNSPSPTCRSSNIPIMPLNCIIMSKPKRGSCYHREREFRGANGVNRAPGTIRTYAHRVPSAAEVCFAAGLDGACLAGRMESDPFAERPYVYRNSQAKEESHPPFIR